MNGAIDNRPDGRIEVHKSQFRLLGLSASEPAENSGQLVLPMMRAPAARNRADINESAFAIYNTEYRTVIDLTAKRYFFELATSPNVIWADLSKMNLSPGAPVMILNPDSTSLSGNVSDKFRKAAKASY